MDEVIGLLKIVRDQNNSLDHLLDGGHAQARASARVAERKLKDMGFDPPLSTSGVGKGLPMGWTEHAAKVIAVIEGYGLESAQRAVAEAQAEARTKLGKDELPA